MLIYTLTFTCNHINNSYYDEEILALISSLDNNKCTKGYFETDFKISTKKAPAININRKQKRMRLEKKDQRALDATRAAKRAEKLRTKYMHQMRDIPKAESAVGTTDSRQGVNLVSRNVTSIAERFDYAGDHSLSDATIKETTWDLTRMLERPSLIKTFDWTNNMAIGPIDLLTAPSGLLVINLTQVPFKSFQYWRGDIVLKIQVAGSPLLQGILMVTFIPLVSEPEAEVIAKDLSSLTINPTTYLYANTNTVAELRIPYNHPQSYLDTNFPSDLKAIQFDQNLGYIVITVLEPILVVGDVTKVTVSLFSMFENSQFKVPRLSSQIIPKAESGIMSAIESLTDMAGVVEPALHETAQQLKYRVQRKGHKTQQHVVDEISAKATPHNIIGDVLDFASEGVGSILGMMGLDNPTAPLEHGRQIVKTNGSMNYCTAPEFIEKMMNHPASLSLVTAETFGTLNDEMNLAYLYRKYSYVGRFTISRTAGIGTLLYTLPLNPFPTINQVPFAATGVVPFNSIIQNNVTFPLLSYLGLPFRYWTGGLRYKFLICASSLHTCKLFVSFNYGLNKPTDVINLIDATSQYGVALEINQGSNEFEFTAPYIATTPYKDVTTGSILGDNTMGWMGVYVMNQLIATSTVAPTISVAVFICGGDDFSYEHLGGLGSFIPVDYDITNSSVSGVINRGEDEVVDTSASFLLRPGIPIAESGVMNAETTAPLNVAPTVTDVSEHPEGQEDIAPPQIASTVDDHFSLSMVSLRDIAKRYQYAGSITLDALPATLEMQGAYIDIAKLIGTTGLWKEPSILAKIPFDSNGYLGWLAGMYRQFRGSLRLKIIVDFKTLGSKAESIPTTLHAIFQPGYVPPSGTVPPSAILSSLITQTLTTADWVNTQYPTQPTPTTYTTIMRASSPKYTILNGVISNVLEFEIPYTSKYLSVIPASDFADIAYTNLAYRSLGGIFLYCSTIGVLVPTAHIFISLGDEARYGNLYRIPPVYIPALFSTGPTPTAVANFGYNTFATAPITGRMRSLVSGRTRAGRTIPNLIDIPLAESGVASGMRSRASSINSTTSNSGKASWKYWLLKKMVGFVLTNSHCSTEEFNAFIKTLTPIPSKGRYFLRWACSSEGMRMLAKSGVTETNDGHWVLSVQKRTRRHRRIRANKKKESFGKPTEVFDPSSIPEWPENVEHLTQEIDNWQPLSDQSEVEKSWR